MALNIFLYFMLNLGNTSHADLIIPRSFTGLCTTDMTYPGTECKCYDLLVCGAATPFTNIQLDGLTKAANYLGTAQSDLQTVSNLRSKIPVPIVTNSSAPGYLVAPIYEPIFTPTPSPSPSPSPSPTVTPPIS